MLERLNITKYLDVREKWEQLLTDAGLKRDPPYSVVYGIYEDDRLVATGARDDKRLKCIAIDPQYQGGNLFNELLSGMIMDASDTGIDKLFLYAKPEAVMAFSHLGFQSLASTPQGITFMERGELSLDDYLDRLRETAEAYEREHRATQGPIESIVMNANPFTSGHRALIENALTRAKRLHLFILSEDISTVPTEIRLRLVMEGTSDLNGIIYHPTESYIISNASFPSYFLKKESETTKTQATLDAILFRDKIAPALGITNRTVGDEPYDPVTSIYNNCLEEQFEGKIKLTIMPRINTDKGTPISGSLVRSILMTGKVKDIRPFVPQTTYRFFNSREGRKLVRSWHK